MNTDDRHLCLHSPRHTLASESQKERVLTYALVDLLIIRSDLIIETLIDTGLHCIISCDIWLS